MSNPYITNSDIYQSNAERDISVILSRFNTEYIYDCIENALAAKNTAQFIIQNPNLVRSLETCFMQMRQDYPDDIENIMACRQETYLEIIHYLCSKFNLIYNDNDNLDPYSTAYYLYEFLVGEYLNKLCKFYSKYILMEKNNLYKTLNLERFKKNANLTHSKKVIKDSAISTILIQTPFVIDQLMAFDFDFESIVNIVYDDSNLAKFITSVFFDNGYFYNFYKQDICNSFIRPNIITNIRLSIQDQCIAEGALANFIKEG